MIKDMPYYYLPKGKTISLRDIFSLGECDDIKLIVIGLIEEEFPNGKVEIRIGEEEPKIIEKNKGFTWGFGHLISSSLNVRNGVVEGTITALEDSVLTIGITLR